MVMSEVSRPMKTRLADPTLRREVEAAVRRRVPGSDAEDVVQATLTDVLSAAHLPEDPEEFRRFVFGVARHKVFDHFRRQRRAAEAFDENETAGLEQPLSERDILRWAEGELPDSESHKTLQWMLREGDGEKLEQIARDARLPAPRVRQRVWRLRKLLRERWAAELTLAGLVLLLVGFGAIWFAAGRDPHDVVERELPRPEPVPTPSAPRELAPSRPAGGVEPLPSAPSQVLPAPSAGPPAPSAVPPAPSAVPPAPSAQHSQKPLPLRQRTNTKTNATSSELSWPSPPPSESVRGPAQKAQQSSDSSDSFGSPKK